MIDGQTALYSSIAYPNRGAKSPLIWNAAFESLGFNCVFLAFEPRDLEKAIDSIRVLNIRGSSISTPYKEEVLRYLDEVDETARSIGAVNTVLNDNGRLIGYNYDWVGAVRALETQTNLAGMKVVVVGAGGAGRAIVFGLKRSGSEVVVFDENTERAKRVAMEFDVVFGGGCVELNQAREYDILVHATPVGSYLFPDQCAVPKNILVGGKVVFDVVFNPIETPLMKDARGLGCKVVQGYKMLVYQAAAQFKLFTSVDAPLTVMEQALLKTY